MGLGWVQGWSRWRVGLVGLFIIYLAAFQTVAPPPAFRPGPDTTVFDRPLDADGLVDFAAALNARVVRPSPDENAVIPLLSLIGPEGWPAGMARSISRDGMGFPAGSPPARHRDTEFFSLLGVDAISIASSPFVPLAEFEAGPLPTMGNRAPLLPDGRRETPDARDATGSSVVAASAAMSRVGAGASGVVASGGAPAALAGATPPSVTPGAGSPPGDVPDATTWAPWTATAHPGLAAWIAANEATFGLLASAAARPGWFLPRVSGEDPTDLGDAPITQNGRLLTSLRGLGARAMLRLGAGDDDGALADLSAGARLGVSLAAQDQLVLHLVGLVTVSRALGGLELLLRSPQATIARCERISALLAAVDPLPGPHAALFSEWLGKAALVQHMVWQPRGAPPLMPAAISGGGGLDFNHLARRLLEDGRPAIDAVARADLRDRLLAIRRVEEALDRRRAAFTAGHSLARILWVRLLVPRWWKAQAASDLVVDMLGTIGEPRWQGMVEEHAVIAARARLLRVATALRRWRLAGHPYPETLPVASHAAFGLTAPPHDPLGPPTEVASGADTGIVGAGVATAASDVPPFAPVPTLTAAGAVRRAADGTAFEGVPGPAHPASPPGYRREGDGFRLWSIGPDLVDDGGRPLATGTATGGDVVIMLDS